MYKLYSERIRNKDGEPEIYIYDEFPDAFRNQVFYIMTDILDRLLVYDGEPWDTLYAAFSREKGVGMSIYQMETGDYGKPNFNEYIKKANEIDLLDMIDFVFNFMDENLGKQVLDLIFGGMLMRQ